MQTIHFQIGGPSPITFDLNAEGAAVPALEELAKFVAIVSSKPGFNLQGFIAALMQLLQVVPQLIAAFVPTFNLAALLAALPAAIQALTALIAAITG